MKYRHDLYFTIHLYHRYHLYLPLCPARQHITNKKLLAERQFLKKL